jgi:hypothetical protein
VVVSPSTVVFPILPFFITFKGDFSFITREGEEKQREKKGPKR